jgi:hypothetical protein
MKKAVIVLSIIVLASFSVSAFAEDDPAPFRVDANLGANLCIGGLYPYLEGVFVWKPIPFIGLGAGVDSYIGLNAKDLWLAPLARVELGWFYLTGGPSFLLTPPDRAVYLYPELKNNTGIYLGLGLSHGILQLGPGKLGFDARLSYAFAPIPNPEVPETDNIVQAIVAAMVTGIFAAYVDVLAGIRLGAGVTYSLPIGG